MLRNLTNYNNSRKGECSLLELTKEIRNAGKWWNINELGNIDTVIKLKEKEMEQLDLSNADTKQTAQELDTLYHHKDQMLWKKTQL